MCCRSSGVANVLTIKGRTPLLFAGHCSSECTSVLWCTCSFQATQVVDGLYCPSRRPAGHTNSWHLWDTEAHEKNKVKLVSCTEHPLKEQKKWRRDHRGATWKCHTCTLPRWRQSLPLVWQAQCSVDSWKSDSTSRWWTGQKNGSLSESTKHERLNSHL